MIETFSFILIEVTNKAAIPFLFYLLGEEREKEKTSERKQ